MRRKRIKYNRNITTASNRLAGAASSGPDSASKSRFAVSLVARGQKQVMVVNQSEFGIMRTNREMMTCRQVWIRHITLQSADAERWVALDEKQSP